MVPIERLVSVELLAVAVKYRGGAKPFDEYVGCMYLDVLERDRDVSLVTFRYGALEEGRSFRLE
jgi:hypothetical protein